MQKIKGRNEGEVCEVKLANNAKVCEVQNRRHFKP